MFNRIVFGDIRQQGVFCLEIEIVLSYVENMVYYEITCVLTLTVLCQ
jgi:hypothetical protein